MKSLHFISGLPRSGSTLLAALLRQNPKITSGVSSPLCQLVRAIVSNMSRGELSLFYTDEARDAIVKAAVEAFYRNADIAVDTNRFWTCHMPLIAHLFPSAKVICCVRNLGWIINSVERATRANPSRASSIYEFRADSSVYERAEALMDPRKGLIARPYAALKEAWFGEFSDRLILVEYDKLVADPSTVLREIYAACCWEPFQHDFNRVSHDEPALDETLLTPGLHRVTGPVRRTTQRLLIPPDVFDKFSDSAFWEHKAWNVRGVKVA